MENRTFVPKRIQAVLFDLDGTLVKSDLDFEKIRREIGIVEGSILEHLEGLDQESRTEAWAILERHERDAAENSSLMEGVDHVLRRARERGLFVAVITRNSRQSLEHVLDKLDLRFDLTLTREDGPPKPSPWPVLEACRHFKVAPDETLMVGDFRYDIQSGRAAGAWTAYLRRGPQDSDIHLADIVLEKLADLLDWL